MRRTKKLPRFIWPLVISIILGVVYFKTLLPGVGSFGDTTKFQFLGYILGTPHATGYPGYLLLNYFFTHAFPFGSIAFKSNLLSALLSIGGLLFFYQTLILLKVKELSSFIAAISLGFTLTLWSQSIIAEVYSLHLFFTAAVIYYLIKWKEKKHAKGLIIACAFYAFSFGNHMTTVLLLPAFIYWVLKTDAKVLKNPKIIIPIIGVIFLGALQYIYPFWRYYSSETTLLEMQTPDLKSFWWYVSGAQFTSKFFAFNLNEFFTVRIPFLLKDLFLQYSFFWLIAVWGLLKNKYKQLNIFLGIFVICTICFSLNYDIFDISLYFIPLTYIGSFYIAFGLNNIERHISYKKSLTVIFFLIPISLLYSNYRIVDLSSSSTEKSIESTLQMIENDSLMLSSNYSLSNQWWYFLIGLEQGKDRNIFAFHENPELISTKLRLFFDEGIPYDLPLQRTQASTSMKIYIHGEALKKRLEEDAYQISKTSSGLYLVEAKPKDNTASSPLL